MQERTGQRSGTPRTGDDSAPRACNQLARQLGSDHWSLDHLGHVVRDLEAAANFYCGMLGFSREESERSDEHKVDILFLRRGDTTIELLTPHSGNAGLEKFLEKRGEGFHHLCFKVEDLAGELSRLAALGVRLIDQRPRKGSRDTMVAFLHPSSCCGMLIELCEARAKVATPR